MASTNVPHRERLSDGFRRAADRAKRVVDPVSTPLGRAARFVTNSVFRFMILFGFVVIGIAHVFLDEHVAGHLGIYGVTAIAVGVLGRLVVRWKLRDAS